MVLYICLSIASIIQVIGNPPHPLVNAVESRERLLQSFLSHLDILRIYVYADTIPLPLTEKGRDYFIESDSYYYYAQYSHYGPISYDPWKKIYYRFVGIGLNDWDLEPSPRLQTQKKWSVMVFDTSFRKLGEQYLGDAYHVDYHFVSPDGLFILNKGKNEDVAEYTLFKYKDK